MKPVDAVIVGRSRSCRADFAPPRPARASADTLALSQSCRDHRCLKQRRRLRFCASQSKRGAPKTSRNSPVRCGLRRAVVPTRGMARVRSFARSPAAAHAYTRSASLSRVCTKVPDASSATNPLRGQQAHKTPESTWLGPGCGGERLDRLRRSQPAGTSGEAESDHCNQPCALIAQRTSDPSANRRAPESLVNNASRTSSAQAGACGGGSEQCRLGVREFRHLRLRSAAARPRPVLTEGPGSEAPGQGGAVGVSPVTSTDALPCAEVQRPEDFGALCVHLSAFCEVRSYSNARLGLQRRSAMSPKIDSGKMKMACGLSSTARPRLAR